MEGRLELVFVPVSDVDWATEFYRDRLGFVEDFDTHFSDDVRMVQLTPAGSGCSIAFLWGMGPGAAGRGPMTPGSLVGLTLVVSDITAARAELLEAGVGVTDVMQLVYEQDGPVYRRVEGTPLGWNAYAFFDDPDGNGWVLQQSPPD
jgi:catechol 2,3-dioxygenase-like lactoylglutathione lyase family enzyme